MKLWYGNLLRKDDLGQRKLMRGQYTSECSTHGETRNAYIIIVGNTVRNRQLGRPGHKWEYNNDMNLKEIYVKM
jgi:hypothetical protein